MRHIFSYPKMQMSATKAHLPLALYDDNGVLCALL